MERDFRAEALAELTEAVRLALVPHVARLQARGEHWTLNRNASRQGAVQIFATVSLLGRPMPADDREIEAVLSMGKDSTSARWNVDAMTATQLDADDMQRCQSFTDQKTVRFEQIAETLLGFIPQLVSHLDEVLARLDAGDRDRIC